MIQAMREEAQRYAADPSLQLVFLHLPTPHPPHFYDRHSRTFTGRSPGAAGSYPDSLALADLILGEIREAMTRAGLWTRPPCWSAPIIPTAPRKISTASQTLAFLSS